MRRLSAALAAALMPLAALADPISGYEFMEPATRQLQDDDFLNPAFFLVDRGAALWDQPWPGAEGTENSCRSCHGDPSSMAGVSARYPEFAPETGLLENVEARIRREIASRFGVQPPQSGDQDLIALTMLIGLQSRGMPISVPVPPEAKDLLALGEEIYTTRRGQLNLACSHCHEDNWGSKLRGDTISQGQINAFPIFRLIWDEVGTLDRMFTWCMEAVRAEPYREGSQEYRALELYLAQRASGLAVETPGVRR